MKKMFEVILFLLLALPAAGAQEMQVVATNSWTAAFVAMAGGHARILAPASMNHPPEYELRPSDVQTIKEADLLVYAGYEVLMKTVFESFPKDRAQFLQIGTSYDPDQVAPAVLAIAERLGTTAKARENLAAYRKTVDTERSRLALAGAPGLKVVVNFHQAPALKALGFGVKGIFGPQPLEAGKIRDLVHLAPDLLVDNIHNPLAAPLEEILGTKAVILANFPGHVLPDGSRCPDDLGGMVSWNASRLYRRLKDFPELH